MSRYEVDSDSGGLLAELAFAYPGFWELLHLINAGYELCATICKHISGRDVCPAYSSYCWSSERDTEPTGRI